jgi:hypothetical protein
MKYFMLLTTLSHCQAIIELLFTFPNLLFVWILSLTSVELKLLTLVTNKNACILRKISDTQPKPKFWTDEPIKNQLKAIIPLPPCFSLRPRAQAIYLADPWTKNCVEFMACASVCAFITAAMTAEIIGTSPILYSAISHNCRLQYLRPADTQWELNS